MFFREIPGLALGSDLSLRIGDGPELRLTPGSGYVLAEALVRRATENAMREAALKSLEDGRPRAGKLKAT